MGEVLVDQVEMGTMVEMKQNKADDSICVHFEKDLMRDQDFSANNPHPIHLRCYVMGSSKYLMSEVFRSMEGGVWQGLWVDVVTTFHEVSLLH